MDASPDSVTPSRALRIPRPSFPSLIAQAVIAIAFLIAVSARPTFAQAKDDPLTEKEIDDLREVADQPLERVKLFMSFISQRTDAIQEMTGDTRIQNKPPKLHKLFEEYTRLVDELQDNLDGYDDTHSDIRKALKELVPASQKWLDIVNKPPPDQNYDFTRKSAAEAGGSLVEQVKKLQADQIKWFAEHKKDKKDDTQPSSPPR